VEKGMPVLELLAVLVVLEVVAVGLLGPLVLAAGAALDERVVGISLPAGFADDDAAAAVVVAVVAVAVAGPEGDAGTAVEAAVAGSFNFSLRLAVVGRVTGVSESTLSSSSDDSVSSTLL